MEIYISPELIDQDKQILNIVDQNQQAVGFLSLQFDDKKMYIFGNLQEVGVKEDFKDLIKPYVNGMSKNKADLEVYSYVSLGGEKFDLEASEEDQKES
ncbi:hypothetical protein DCC39_01645 [Pueribacillus theae]|uniref:Uncharacterized protein n=1 Tax=Pueribacillus theae TaxID=2171751 RepID=A0A2U1K6N1_9BACI|nr:hypothetical protein [Pueribacillus theae]PWA13180.1 hypothetical protein DCC39_01645 [Pueribacillus theae]